MPLDLLFMDGLKRSEADVQRNCRRFDAPLPQPLQNLPWRKVQAGGRRRHSSRVIRKNRSGSARGPRRVGLPAKCGGNGTRGQRRSIACATSPFLRRQAENQAQPILAASKHFGDKISVSEFDALSHANLAPGPDQSFPLVGSDLPGQQNF